MLGMVQIVVADRAWKGVRRVLGVVLVVLMVGYRFLGEVHIVLEVVRIVPVEVHIFLVGVRKEE